jgi:hypothetical protein
MYILRRNHVSVHYSLFPVSYGTVSLLSTINHAKGAPRSRSPFTLHRFPFTIHHSPRQRRNHSKFSIQNSTLLKLHPPKTVPTPHML